MFVEDVINAIIKFPAHLNISNKKEKHSSLVNFFQLLKVNLLSKYEEGKLSLKWKSMKFEFYMSSSYVFFCRNC